MSWGRVALLHPSALAFLIVYVPREIGWKTVKEVPEVCMWVTRRFALLVLTSASGIPWQRCYENDALDPHHRRRWFLERRYQHRGAMVLSRLAVTSCGFRFCSRLFPRGSVHPRFRCVSVH